MGTDKPVQGSRILKTEATIKNTVDGQEETFQAIIR